MSARITLSALNIYPVKSLRGIALQHTQVAAYGLHLDRRWMIVDDKQQMLTQRKLPRMSLIQPTLQQEQLSLNVSGQETFSVPAPNTQNTVQVQVWDDACNVYDCGDNAAAWLSDFLETECRLVFFPDDEQRQVDLNYAQVGDHTAFSDGFPFLLLSQASLDDLNSRLPSPISLQRFRPNIVVSGCEPYAEDEWRKIRINNISFNIVKPCSRCIIPNINPETATLEKEPARTLATYRKQNNKVFFGQNMIAEQTGSMALNDVVEILR